MRILICGAGAIGCFLGGHLALAGHDVVLLGRPHLVQSVARNGLVLRLKAGNHVIRNIKVIAALSAATERFDLITFTMKAYDTSSMAYEISETKHLLGTPIVSFQNGIGNEEILEAVFGGPENVIAGTVTTPVSIDAEKAVIEEKRRGIAVALDSRVAEVAIQAFKVTALRLSTPGSSRSLKWSKLLLNILGNASSAILDMMPEDVYASPDLFALERNAFLEALAVLKLLHVELVNLPGMPAKLLAFAMQYLPTISLQPILKHQVGVGRGHKPPSLLLALRNDQTRTEVAWLNGAVANAARSVGHLAPVNHTLALLVSDLATGRADKSMFRHQPQMLLSAVHAALGMANTR